MHTRTWKMVVLGLALAGFGPAAAAFAKGGGGGGKEAGAFIDREIKMADTNNDQKLSADEHANGARQMFTTMDADKDGRVTAQEMESAHAQMMGKAPGKTTGSKARKSEKTAAEKIKTCDTNNDGALAAEEHDTCSRTMFTRMDTDQDGQLTRAELKSGHARMMHKGGEHSGEHGDTGAGKPAEK